MKKTGKNLLAALLCLLLPVSALASPGDMLLAYRDTETGEGFADRIRCGGVLGDTLALFGREAVYLWKTGDADLNAYPWAEDRYAVFTEEYGPGDGNEPFIAADLAFFTDGTDAYAMIGAAAYDSNAGWIHENAALAKVVFEGGTANLALMDGVEPDWEMLTRENAYDDPDDWAVGEVLPYTEQIVCIGETLYVYTDREDGRALTAVPLNGDYANAIEDIDLPSSIGAYKDGKLLFVYTEADGCSFAAFDPQTSDMQPLCSFRPDKPGRMHGAVYSPKEDCIYIGMNASLHRIGIADGEHTVVNALPPQADFESALLLGKFYIQIGSTCVVVRSTDPAQRGSRKLTVYVDSFIQDIDPVYYAYAAAHGDVTTSVVKDRLSAQQMIEQMMSRSAEYDLFIIDSSSYAFSALLDRGYMADLRASDEIAGQFALLYPGIGQAFSRDGKPSAMPVMASSIGLGINHSAMRQIGLTEEDIPANWPDFLGGLDEMYAACAREDIPLFPSDYTQRMLREELFGYILGDYLLYMRAEGENSISTPALISALEALDSIDFGLLGVRDGESILSSDSESLLTFFAERTIGQIGDSCTPLLLAMREDARPYLGLNCGAAFINPYSENQDLALAFIEAALSCMDDGMRGSLFDIEIEPRRPEYYEESQKMYDERIAALNKALAEAEESERQELEDLIATLERWKEYEAQSSWLISPGAIAWYGANSRYIVPDAGSVLGLLESSETAASVNAAMEQYCEGTLDAVQLAQALDEKLEMMLLEGK